MRVPTWLDTTAKQFWKLHINNIELQPEQVENFAILCQTYSDYRNAADPRQRKMYLDYVLKYSKEFGLTPRSKRGPGRPTTDELSNLFTN